MGLGRSQRSAPARDRRQPAARVLQSDALTARLRAIGIGRILDADAQQAVVCVRGDVDRSAIDHRRDPVPNGIFNQRLQQQRRHETTSCGLIDLDLCRQARAEAHFLDRKVSRYEIDLFGKRDAVLRSDAQRQPEKIGHQLRHLTSVFGARSAKRCHGIETVEEKVWIDLGLERFELRFARQHLISKCGLLGGARCFQLQRQIVHDHGALVDRDADAEDQRDAGGRPPREHPQAGGGSAGTNVRREHARKRRPAQRHRTAVIARRQRDHAEKK